MDYNKSEMKCANCIHFNQYKKLVNRKWQYSYCCTLFTTVSLKYKEIGVVQEITKDSFCEEFYPLEEAKKKCE